MQSTASFAAWRRLWQCATSSSASGEERTNLILLCERCHLELVHGDKLRVSGHAPHGLTWHAKGWAIFQGRPARESLTTVLVVIRWASG